MPANTARTGAVWSEGLLARGDAALGHMHPDPAGFEASSAARAALRGRHILLLDDTYVSGARAQSAAATLRLAGAASVRILVIGRVLRPERVPAHASFLRLQTLAPGHPAPCRWCASTHGVQ